MEQEKDTNLAGTKLLEDMTDEEILVEVEIMEAFLAQKGVDVS